MTLNLPAIILVSLQIRLSLGDINLGTYDRVTFIKLILEAIVSEFGPYWVLHNIGFVTNKTKPLAILGQLKKSIYFVKYYSLHLCKDNSKDKYHSGNKIEKKKSLQTFKVAFEVSD